MADWNGQLMNLDTNNATERLANMSLDYRAPVNCRERMDNILSDLRKFSKASEEYSDRRFLWHLYSIGEYDFAEDFSSWVSHQKKIWTPEDLLKMKRLFHESKIKNEDSYMTICREAILNGKYNFLAMLAKLGKRIKLPADLSMQPNPETVFTIFRKNYVDHHDPKFRQIVDFVSLRTPRRKRISTVLAIINDRQPSSEYSNIFLNRIPIVRWGVDIFSKSVYMPSMTDRYAKCLKLIFDDIPDPKVSSHEVMLYLRHITNDVACEEHVNKLVEMYVEFMPESVHPYSPRSLKHLCRCQARKLLRDHNKLPDEVPSLHLPEELVKYLKLEL